MEFIWRRSMVLPLYIYIYIYRRGPTPGSFLLKGQKRASVFMSNLSGCERCVNFLSIGALFIVAFGSSFFPFFHVLGTLHNFIYLIFQSKNEWFEIILPAKSRRRQSPWCTWTLQGACVVPVPLQTHGKRAPENTRPVKLKCWEWWWMSSSTNWGTSWAFVVLSSRWSKLDGWWQTAMSNIWGASVYGVPAAQREAADVIPEYVNYLR